MGKMILGTAVAALILLGLAGCGKDTCRGSVTLHEYKLVNASGQKIAIALNDRYEVFPDSVVLADGENFQWTSPTELLPFSIRKRKFDIYFNDTVRIKGSDYPDERNISRYEAYEPIDYILTFTFGEADYLYALEHGTVVGPQ